MQFGVECLLTQTVYVPFEMYLSGRILKTLPSITHTNATLRHLIPPRSKMPAKIVCLGNPLLDLQATTTTAYLDRYHLKPNDAILVANTPSSKDQDTDPRMAIFEEILKFDDVKFVAGGAAQNTARGAAWVLGDKSVAYFGSVARDKYSELLLSKNAEAGVVSYYQIQQQDKTGAPIGTGKCAALITGHNRSLVTDLGAANYFTPDFLDEHWDVVESAELFYIGGFHLTVSPEAILKLGEYAKRAQKPFVLNLSAPFIPQFYKDPLDKVLPPATHIIANETEAASLAEHFSLGSGLTDSGESLAAIGRKLLEKYGDDKTVVFTHGLEPTVVITRENTREYKVVPVDSNKIVDTNGAGDAFAAGFIAGLVQGKSLEECVNLGHWVASLSIQEVGPSYPRERMTR